MDIEPNNTLFVETSGYSMWPFLRPGVKLIVKKVLPAALRPGDLLVFREKEQIVCHRLVRQGKADMGTILYVRGDSSFVSVQKVPFVHVIGKAVGFVKNDRRIVSLNGIGWRCLNPLIVVLGPLISRIARWISLFVKEDR